MGFGTARASALDQPSPAVSRDANLKGVPLSAAIQLLKDPRAEQLVDDLLNRFAGLAPCRPTRIEGDAESWLLCLVYVALAEKKRRHPEIERREFRAGPASGRTCSKM